MKHLKLQKAFESWIFWYFEYKQGFGKGFKACSYKDSRSLSHRLTPARVSQSGVSQHRKRLRIESIEEREISQQT